MPRITTACVLAEKTLDYSCGKRCVEWAIGLLDEGHDSRDLRILAGLVPPYNHFEISDYRNRVLAAFGFECPDRVDAVKILAADHLGSLLSGEGDFYSELQCVADLCIQEDYPRDLMDFYNLYFAFDELLHSSEQYYWEGANRKNIRSIIRTRAQEFVRTMTSAKHHCILFDWGDTVMRNFPDLEGPMHLWPRVEPIPGIREALRVLQPTSIVALATNAVDSDEKDIRKALDRCDLSRFFDRVFCYRKLGFRKPHSSFYRAILNELELPSRSVFMVGDSFESDVQAANAVGISAVWFNPNTEDRRVGALHDTVHDLGDLPRALKGLTDRDAVAGQARSR